MNSRPLPAERFQELDIHDDTIEEFRFVPGKKPRTGAKLEVTLYRHWENKRRMLTFSGCANYQVVVDADILRDNSPNNTCSAEASTDENEIVAVMRKHKRAWNVSYQKSIDPLQGKLDASNKYTLFRLRLYGGNLEIIARSFTIRRISNSMQTEGQHT